MNENKSGATPRYVYRDFSRILPDEGESVLGAIVNSLSGPASIKQQKLPIKLNALLSDPELSQIIGWMPHGRAWRILKPKLFVKVVLPLYFDYCNYNSFVRLINAWGFRRLNTGPDRHAYYHELFLKGMPHLHSRMRRITCKDEKPPIDQEDEPDLYRISQLFPVPPPTTGMTPSTSTTDLKITSVLSPEDSEVKNVNAVDPSFNDFLQSSKSRCSESGPTDYPPIHHTSTNVAMATAPFNPYVALAAQQAQQVSAQQQSYLQFLSAAASLPVNSGIVQPFAPVTQQQVQHQFNLACLSFLQGSMPGTVAPVARQPTVSVDPSAESPVMYIPVYPSTLAALCNNQV